MKDKSSLDSEPDNIAVDEWTCGGAAPTQNRRARRDRGSREKTRRGEQSREKTRRAKQSRMRE
jgi:hypothetical protein